MNIEKIKNYNQAMLSIVVTAAVVFAIVGLFAFIFFLLTEVFDVFSNRSSQPYSAYQTETYSKEGEAELKDKLFIAYGFPELIDTLNQIYIIPVGLKSTDQLRNEYSKEVLFSSEKTYGDGDPYYSNKTFSNLLIYNAKSQKTEMLFTKKVLIEQYGQEYFNDDILVLAEAASSDTDKDGEITMSDQTSVFVYSLTNRIIKQIKYNDLSVLNFKFIAKTKDMIVKFGINPSKIYEHPEKVNNAVLCKYNFASDQLIPINDEKLQKELQAIEGKK